MREYLQEANKEHISTLLTNATCTMTSTMQYARRGVCDECLAEVTMYVPMDRIRKFTDKIKNELLNEFNLIFPRQAGFYFSKIQIAPLIDNSFEDSQREVTPHFEEIQSRIIDELQTANFLIWVAVSWFTDKVLFKQLVDSKNRGINVQLIVIDDDTNRKYGFNYESEFETYRIPPTEPYKNIMHHKFCIVDLKTLIRGGYNWTNKARFNGEDITIEHDRQLTEAYAERFVKLKRWKSIHPEDLSEFNEPF